MTYGRNLFIAFSQIVNAVCYGHADETLSSRAYRQGGWLERVINVIMWRDPDHCQSAYLVGASRRAVPVVDRKF